MNQIILKLFNEEFVDMNLVKLIREFTGPNDIDCFIQNIMKCSTGHEDLFGVEFKFKLGKHNVKVVSKFNSETVTLELRSRGFQRVRSRMECIRNQIANFDDWIVKTQEYYELCETFLYFIVHRFRDGLVTCNTCDKLHWCDCLETCRGCIKVFNSDPCPICKSYFGVQPHRHIFDLKSPPSWVQ